MKAQLAATAQAVTQLDQRLASLQDQIGTSQARVDRERAQVRLLARAVYAEPSSPLLIVFSSTSLSDALTRIGDLTEATDRAAATRRALDLDLANLNRQRSDMRSSLQREQGKQRELQAQWDHLVALAAAAEAATVATPGVHVAAAPPAPAAAPNFTGGTAAIKQLIWDTFAPLGPGAQAWAERIAACESGYNPNAVNRSSAASGLFQFLPSTWAHTPFGGQSVFNPAANAQAAAWYYNATGRSGGPWSCK